MFQAVVRLSSVPCRQQVRRRRLRRSGHRSLVAALDLAPVGVGGLEDVTQCALGVVHLRLEVVALADHRRVQLDAGTDDKTQFVVGVALRSGPKMVVIAR